MSTVTLRSSLYHPASPIHNYLLSPSTPGSMPSSMDTNTSPEASDVDGVGMLTYQRAIDVARNTEGDLDPNISNYLERAIRDIWERINQLPASYLMTKDEFAVFNYYILRFDGQAVAQQAVERYWRHTSSMDQPAT